MKYTTNFHTNTDLNGNAVKSGDTLVINLEGAGTFASGAIYDGDYPILADFDDISDGKVELKFKLVERVNGQYQGLPTGTYVLKIRAGNGQGIDDQFFID